MKVYYDQFDEALAPVWMLLPINPLEWQLERFYVALRSPFEQFMTEDFDNNLMYVAVQFEDLIRNWKEQESIGISLSSIRRRFEALKMKTEIADEFSVSDVSHMIVRMADIEEVLQMDIRSYYDWEA